MAITADDRYLFTSDYNNGDVKQFRVSDGRMIKDYGPLFGLGIGSMITTPDNKYLFAGSDRYLKQVCLESKQVVHDYGQIHVREICF
jgi:hypothetical protein